MTAQNQEEPLPVYPKRVKAFVVFFKHYMSLSTLAVASLPIPVAAFGLIPTYSAQTKLLSVYTSLFCFLTLGFIFYSRHSLARLMFPEHFGRIGRSAHPLEPGRVLIVFLPLLFIAASIFSVFKYHDYLKMSVEQVVYSRQNAGYAGPLDFNNVLETTRLNEIWYSSRLMILYISIFLTAEAAFITMAIKEYLQDLVGLTEMDLIRGPQAVEKT